MVQNSNISDFSISPVAPCELVLAVTGSVAAYKAAELARLLVGDRFKLTVVMTPSACQFIGPPTFQAISGRPVLYGMWDDEPVSDDGMDHIAVSRAARAIIVAPATANCIAKTASGVCDDLVSAMISAASCPILMAPAMNREMWLNPANLRNIKRISEDGILVVGPGEGVQACGETGIGRMVEPEDIQAALRSVITSDLAGLNVLVSVGATMEPVDPMRAVTNRSSGKMGMALATAARDAGARVTVVAGPCTAPLPAGVTDIRVVTAAEMESALLSAASGADVFFSAAAVADYRPSKPSRGKIASSERLTLELERTPDILKQVANLPDGPLCVGFAAESGDLERRASAKRRRKGVALIAANDILETVGADTCRLTLIGPGGVERFPELTKRAAAQRLVARAASLLAARRGVAQA